ncbi:MAG: class II aldolase/adducin family protein [Chitinophagales bacterium]
MPSEEAQLRQQIVDTGKYLVERGLVVGTAGNISARLGEHRFVVTPSGMDYHRFGPDDLCVVDWLTGEIVGSRRPSIETGLHAAVYRNRPDVWAVVHTHSLFATAVAASRRELPCILDAMALQFGGGVPVAKYGIPGSRQLADQAVWALGKRGAVLLANHGVVAVGRDLKDALSGAELVERAAQIMVYASSVGKAVPLDPEEVGRVRVAFQTSYGQNPGQERPGE